MSNHRHDTCPICKQEAISARHSFQLNAIIHHYNHAKRRRIPDLSSDGARSSAASPDLPTSNEIIYPLGVVPQGVPGSSIGDENIQYDDGDAYLSDSEDSVEFANSGPAPDGPVWPCPSCIVGNTTGYTCPVPIPTPDAPPFPDGSLIPPRGERRASLVDQETGEYRVYVSPLVLPS